MLTAVLCVVLAAGLGAIGWAIKRLVDTLDRMDQRLQNHELRIHDLERTPARSVPVRQPLRANVPDSSSG